MISYIVEYDWKKRTGRRWLGGEDVFDTIEKARARFNEIANNDGRVIDGYLERNPVLIKHEVLS